MEEQMPGRRAQTWLGWLVVASAVLMLAVDGEVSRAEAVDQWVGTITISGQPLDFLVFVNPGVSASFEWKFRNVVVASGPLAATVSGSKVQGTLYFTGGLVAQDPLCCAPCNFAGEIVGNTASGSSDEASCGERSSWLLRKK
jgi:hypothetical protein